jgi:hypothetical protein
MNAVWCRFVAWSGIARVRTVTPRRSRQGRAQRAREHGPGGPRGGLYGCAAAWHNWDERQARPFKYVRMLGLLRLYMDFDGTRHKLTA